MSYSYNRITLIGKVCHIRENTVKGYYQVKFTIKTVRPLFKKDSGVKDPLVDLHWITVWSDRAVLCKQKLKIGDYVCVNGELQHNRDKNDNTKWYTEVHVPDYEKIGFLGSDYETSQDIQQENLQQETMPIINGVKPYASSNSKPTNPFKKSEPIKQILGFDDDIPF